MRRFIGVLVALVTLAILGGRAQERGYVAAKVGLNAQSAEDSESGVSAGVGTAVGYWLGPRWGVEVEGWLPGYIEKDGKRFRDSILAVSAMRRWDRQAYAPYLTLGFALARVQVQRPGVPSTTTNGYGYLQAGAGVDVRLARSLSIVPELRADVYAASLIVRPAVGLKWRF